MRAVAGAATLIHAIDARLRIATMTSLTPYEPALRIAERTTAAPREAPSSRAACVRIGALATPVARLDAAGASSRGRRKPHNEDAMSELDRGVAVYVVADGVGGGALAARASRELVAHLHRALDHAHIDERALRHALLAADREVAHSIATCTEAHGAATVALCAAVDASRSRWLVAWVGDCRAYRWSRERGGIVQLTRDDTYRHLGEAPPPGGSPDDPARMVGNGAVGIPNVVDVSLGDDDMLVLCSDGVHKRVAGDDLARLLDDRAPLVRRCTRAIALARARGSVDDATLVVIHRRPAIADRSQPGASFHGT